MKIAIVGYGKMGHAIEELAISRGHDIVLIIDSDNAHLVTEKFLSCQDIDVAIEFTTPYTAYQNITTCFKAGIKVISGSTAWLDRWDEALDCMYKQNGSFIYASNFSIGVNIFFAVNQKLAQMMDSQKAYDVSIKEIHHTSKKDAPSGTAATLANDIISDIRRKTKYELINGKRENTSESIPIQSLRIDPAPGTHHVKYSSDIDDLEIIHTAKSRIGFALGAITAAEYLHTREGLFTMRDVLGI